MPHHATSAAALGAEHRSCHTLYIAALGEADQHRFILDQVGFAEGLRGFGGDAGAAVIAVFLGEIVHIVLDEAKDLLRVRQQIFQAGDLLSDLFVLFLDLPALQSGQPAQLHIQNCLRLELAQFEALDQVFLGNVGILRFADGLDDRIQVGQRDQVPIQDVLAGAGFLQLEIRAADDDCLPVLDEDLQSPFQRQSARLAIHQRQQLHAERGLQAPCICTAG